MDDAFLHFSHITARDADGRPARARRVRARARPRTMPTDDDARARAVDLRRKLAGAIAKGKALEREKIALEQALATSRAREAGTTTDGTDAAAVGTALTIARAELESFRAENETLRARLARAEASSEDETDGGSDGTSESEEDGGSGRGTSRLARMRLRIARHRDVREALERALRETRNEAESTTAAANAEKSAAERARREAEEEREAAAQARSNAESAHAESAHARAEAEARVTTLEQEIERLGDELERAEGRLTHLTRAFEAKEEELIRQISSATSSHGASRVETDGGLERERMLEADLTRERAALREAQRDIERLRASEAATMESLLAARASESVWKERAQAAMSAASQAKEAYESRQNHAAADGGDAVVDLTAAEQRAREAETALADARQELAALAAERSNGSTTGAPREASTSALARRLAESEALVLKKNEEISSLTRRFTDLAWRTTMEKKHGTATPVAGSANVATDVLEPLAYKRPMNRRLETILRHRRFIIGSYLVLLHLLAYEYLFSASAH